MPINWFRCLNRARKELPISFWQKFHWLHAMHPLSELHAFEVVFAQRNICTFQVPLCREASVSPHSECTHFVAPLRRAKLRFTSENRERCVRSHTYSPPYVIYRLVLDH